MSTLNAKEMRNAIVQAVSKRPQTKFAKIFHELDQKPSQTNIVLLLQELNEQKDFYVDFNISLKYFLDLYEELAASNKNFLFNEAGLLIHNATKVYDRRLDCVLQRVEDQLATLSNGQEAKQSDEAAAEQPKGEEPAVKTVKKRKRLIESTQDPFDFQWTKRKFKKLAENKRFGLGPKIDRAKLYAQKLHVENHLHPTLWKYSDIVDLENEEEIDSKRNYRLFTSYVEHRYNTLVPDINFRLYYKMKDYLDAEDERDDEEHGNNMNSWPPMSQAFVKRYLQMEDRALASTKRRRVDSPNILLRQSDNNLTINENNVDTSDIEKLTALILGDKTSSIDDTATVTSNNNKLETDLGVLGAILNVADDLTATTEGNKDATDTGTLTASGLDISLQDSVAITNDTTTTSLSNKDESVAVSGLSTLTESGLGSSLEDSAALSGSLNPSDATSTLETTKDHTNTDLNFTQPMEDIATGTVLNSTQIDVDNISNKIDKDSTHEKLESENIKNPNEHENNEILETSNQLSDASNETVTLTVHVETDNAVLNDKNDYCAQPSPQIDEGVCFSDIDESSTLAPITIQIEKSALNGLEKTNDSVEIDLNNLEKYELLPNQTPIEFWPIKLNIFEFPQELIKKLRRPKLLTDLGEEMELFLKARCYKRTRTSIEPVNKRQMKYFDRSASCASSVYMTPPPSPCDSVFLGYDEDGNASTRPRSDEDQIENNCINIIQPMKISEHHQRLSRDSGVGNEMLTTTLEKNTNSLPPIQEQTKETTEVEKDSNELDTIDRVFNKDSVASNPHGIEILEDRLLQAGKNDETNTNELSASNTENPKEQVASSINKDVNPSSSLETATNIRSHDEADTDSFMDLTNLNDSETIDDPQLSLNDNRHVELCDDTVSRIQTWHRKLQPILAKSRERHHFDVFQIGTNILDGFNSNRRPDGSITFQDVMQHQDSSYVSRFFLSTLLLANQGNISLNVKNKCADKPTEWCDVEFKLLSTTRHVVAVEDNIGLMPTKIPTKAKLTSTPATKANSPKKASTPELLPPPSPSTLINRKRKLSIANNPAVGQTVIGAARSINLGGIKTIKPIGKTPRLSSSEDSGIASLESEFLDFSS